MELRRENRRLISRIRSLVLGKLHITAGVADAALSSLATFVAGLIAANILGDAELGIYAVFFTAFNLGQVIANNLIFVPAEVVTVSWPEEARTRVLGQSIKYGIMPSVVGTLAIGIATLITWNIAASDVVIPLAITTAATTLVWPVQDHVRRILHIANRSWAAASVSIANFVATAVAIGGLLFLGVADEWIPFGALALSNLVSLTHGLILARPSTSGARAPEQLRPRELVRSGGWLMLGVGIPAVAAFAVATIITLGAGAEAMGYAEAARIVAHPILVLGTGLGYVIGPRIMRGAIDRDESVARRHHRRFNTFLVSVAALYAAVVGFKWAGNPMAFLVPDAYHVSWLVVATIFANIFRGTLGLVIQELTAARRVRTIALVSAVSVPLQIAAAFTAVFTGAFARPISLTIGNGARLVGCRRGTTSIYEDGFAMNDATPILATQAPPDSGR